MARDGTTLGPGFRFHPTDEELVLYYLKRKVTGRPFRFDPIAVIDMYKFEPWDLPSLSKLKTGDLEWYFFTVLDRKYGSGSRTNRATEKGYWKTTGKDRTIKNGGRDVGMKKTLVYHAGRAPRGTRSNWVMHEYRLVDERLAQAGTHQDALVLCRIFEKSGTGPKNGEKYGAPFIEGQWDDDDVVVVPVPVADQPMVEASWGEIGAFFEANDLEKKLDMGVSVGSADFPSNFYYGECSSYPVHHQGFIKDQDPLVGSAGVFEPQNGQNFNMIEPYAGDIYSVKDGENFVLSHSGSPLKFSYGVDDGEQYMDAIDHPLFGDGGSFLETDDLLKPVEGNSTGPDPLAMGIIDEYLAYSDDDITKYICFDSPVSMEGENSIPDEVPPFIQQNVEGDTNDAFMTNKQDVEADSGNEAAALKLEAENANPIVKQANKWLASIPAPPAFAAEFPSKDIALQIHAAPQSSNSAHVTAGMVSISNITVRGNAMDWMVAKTGGFNTAGFAHPDTNSAAMIPVSGLLCRKTASVLSHGWAFLMMFSVLILSMTYKIGSFMYTGKWHGCN